MMQKKHSYTKVRLAFDIQLRQFTSNYNANEQFWNDKKI